MLRKLLSLGFGFVLVGVLAPTQGFAGLIEVSVNGGVFQNVGLFGNFNTGGNTNCGIAGGSCAEASMIMDNNIGGTGIDVNGLATFITTDTGGATTSALIQATIAIDNTNPACGGAGGAPCPTTNVVVAFVSDEFDPSVAGPAGVGIFGSFNNDGRGNVPLVTAESQAEMDYYANGGVWGGLPGLGSFSLVTPVVSWTGAAPVPFWQLTLGASVGGVQELVGFAGANIAGDSAVIFPVTIEDDDTAFIDAEAPEPGSFLLLGFGLAAAGLIRRRKTA